MNLLLVIRIDRTLLLISPITITAIEHVRLSSTFSNPNDSPFSFCHSDEVKLRRGIRSIRWEKEKEETEEGETSEPRFVEVWRFGCRAFVEEKRLEFWRRKEEEEKTKEKEIWRFRFSLGQRTKSKLNEQSLSDFFRGKFCLYWAKFWLVRQVNAFTLIQLCLRHAEDLYLT